MREPSPLKDINPLKKLPQKYLIKGIKDNEHIKITLLAQSVENAKAQCARQGIYPLEIRELSGWEFVHWRFLRFDSKVSRQDISALFLQISIMLEAHLPLLEAIEVCAKNTKKPALQKALLEISYRLNLGQKLSLSFREQKHIFGAMVWNMIALGERSGDLGEIFKMLSLYYEQEHKNRGKIKRALLYPLLVLCAIIVAFVGLVGFVLPQFMVMFEEMSVNLPFYTRYLLGLQRFFEEFGLVVGLACGVGAVAGYRAYTHSSALRARVDFLTLKIPIFGELVKHNALHRYTFSLFLQLKSTTPLDIALALSNDTIDNLALKNALALVLEGVKNGKSLSLALGESELLDEVSFALICAGERSGRLPDMLQACSQRYNQNAQEKIDLLISLIEPLLSLIMGLLVLFLALGIFVPMWDMSSQAMMI